MAKVSFRVAALMVMEEIIYWSNRKKHIPPPTPPPKKMSSFLFHLTKEFGQFVILHVLNFDFQKAFLKNKCLLLDIKK